MLLWCPKRNDIPSLMLIVLLPLAVSLPQLLGWLSANPALYVGAMTKGFVGGILPGYPYIDPNGGFTTQALGCRAMLDWLHGQVPWWNPYSGVGLPLAAEYQPAAFFPLTLLVLLPQGMVWQHLALQVLAGWGSYALLRHMGLRRLTSTTGGLLYAFNGTLAWFNHASALPVPFLPWMLWGIERARVKAELGLSGGWRLFAVALALSLLAGFPETAYLCGLLALAWAMLRWVQVRSGHRMAFTGRIALGGIVGIALAAPQIWAFFTFLPRAWLGGHGGGFAYAALDPAAVIPSLVAPYVYGPIFAFGGVWPTLVGIWGSIGGYVSLTLLIVAGYGFLSCRNALGWLLLVWWGLAVAKTFGLEPMVSLWNLVPGIPNVAFYRYATPSWELALIILAAWGIDDLMQVDKVSYRCLLGAGLVWMVALVGGLFYGVHLWPHLRASAWLASCAIVSVLWATVTGLVCLGFMLRLPSNWRTLAVAALLVADSMLMFVIPTLSNPRGGRVDMPAITFLRKHLDLQRFYTLGPIQPNYAAYYGIASINHNYLPVPQRWVDWVQTSLDSAADPVSFTGNVARRQDQPKQAQELRRNLANYEWAGVKYVVAPANDNPFLEIFASQTSNAGGNRPLVLQPGGRASGMLPAALVTHAGAVEAVGVLVGNYNNTANGMLKVELCSGSHCASGVANLARSNDNQVFRVPLREPLELAANTPVHYTFVHRGGTAPVALWTYPTYGAAETQSLRGPAGFLSDMGLQIHLYLVSALAQTIKRVYRDKLMDIYELPDPKPYFELLPGDGTLDSLSRMQVAVSCDKLSTLVRRELFFPGWRAIVNGKDVPITPYKGLFQTIHVPRGRSEVRFIYDPPHILWAWLFMWLGLGILFLSLLKRQHPHNS